MWMQVTKESGDKRIGGVLAPPERIEMLPGPNVGRDYKEAVEELYGVTPEEEKQEEKQEQEEEKQEEQEEDE
jgi:hypothetical protein